jgi:cyanase
LRTARCRSSRPPCRHQNSAIACGRGLRRPPEWFDVNPSWNKIPPSKGSLAGAVPTDPPIYRFHEVVQVYGTTLKELIHEQFGDAIMSSIDFEMNIEHAPDPKGDRVKVTIHGRFLPYRKW